MASWWSAERSPARFHFQRFLNEFWRLAGSALAWLKEGEPSRRARGLQLLREWLSSEQLAQSEANGYFDVIGGDSGKRYRIHAGTNMNITELDDAGSPRRGWCFVPEGYLVAGDVMLAQKIALETNERGALAVAKEFSLCLGRCARP